MVLDVFGELAIVKAPGVTLGPLNCTFGIGRQREELLHGIQRLVAHGMRDTVVDEFEKSPVCAGASQERYIKALIEAS